MQEISYVGKKIMWVFERRSYISSHYLESFRRFCFACCVFGSFLHHFEGLRIFCSIHGIQRFQQDKIGNDRHRVRSAMIKFFVKIVIWGDY